MRFAALALGAVLTAAGAAATLPASAATARFYRVRLK